MVLGRIVTVEDEMELFLDRARFRNLVEFEARESNVDGKGEYSMERYLSHDLRRQTPERVGLGELKPDGGVVPLLLAVGQGIAQGVATTIHAPSAPDVLTRIRTYAAFGERQLPERTVMETVAASVDLVVHTTRIAGRRVVASVYEYADFRDGTVTSAELWRYHPDAGRAVRTDLEITDTLTAKLTAAGLDANILDRDPSQARR
jgi:pilus assembly protein CpaF